MMIDDDTLKQLLRINDALFQLCKRRTRMKLHRERPHSHSDRSGQEQIALMYINSDL